MCTIEIENIIQKNLLFVIEMALQHCSLCGSKKGQPQPTDTDKLLQQHMVKKAQYQLE